MPAYHSAIPIAGVRRIGNVAILPIKCTVRGPAACLPKESGQADVIDEALAYFKANVFFRTYEIKSDADRVLIYLTLYIQDCLKKLQRCSSKAQGQILYRYVKKMGIEKALFERRVQSYNVNIWYNVLFRDGT